MEQAATTIRKGSGLQESLGALHDRLAPAEEIFFTWLFRVFAAGVLFGSAWLDDAPPLELAAMAISAYVAIRVITQFPRLVSAAPFENRLLKTIFALGAIVVLGLSFMAVATFADQVAFSVAG